MNPITRLNSTRVANAAAIFAGTATVECDSLHALVTPMGCQHQCIKYVRLCASSGHWALISGT
ncbi:hypothetical protein SCLCIDRAFT_1212049 [Scleroderma citrinum Foug A]|uniref:Uncharacterized protein n=1 Tax=Scleroderma citrinum Foug A TaxID=1036808 RepID=A0A0C3DYP7_9AGAM|nr:hypothetical protein SCLCIDRAFT_1212049 [Scleroderma citrinum Foug A]